MYDNRDNVQMLARILLRELLAIRLLRKSSGESWCRGGMRTKYLVKAEGHAEACISLMWELGLCL